MSSVLCLLLRKDGEDNCGQEQGAGSGQELERPCEQGQPGLFEPKREIKGGLGLLSGAPAEFAEAQRVHPGGDGELREGGRGHHQRDTEEEADQHHQ